MPDSAPPARSARLERIAERVDGWLRPRGTTLGAMSAVALVVALLALLGRKNDAFVVGAAALVVAVVWALLLEAARRGGRRSGARRALSRALPPALLGATSVWMLWPAWTGRALLFLEQDNTVHSARAKLFCDALLHGRWAGFTVLFQGGESIGDSYGFLGNVFPLIFRAATLGRWSFDRAYQASVASAHLGISLAVYALCKRFARTSIAFLVALLFFAGGQIVPEHALDKSIWHIHLHVGMWHSLWASAFCLLATAKLVDVARRGRTRDVVLAAVLATAGIWMHGYGAIMWLLLGGGVSLGAAMAPRPTRRRAKLVALAVVAGVLLSGAWFVPYSRLVGELALRFPERANEAQNHFLEFFGQPSTRTLLLGAGAMVAACFHRSRLVRGLALGGLATILTDRNEVLAELGLLDLPLGRGMQWHRLAEIFVFTSPVAIAALLETVVPRTRAPLAARSLAGRAAALTVFVIFLLPSAGSLVVRGTTDLMAIRPYPYDDHASFLALEEEMRALRTRDPSPYRVYWEDYRNGHAAMRLAADTGVPILVIWMPPGLFLKNRPQSLDVADARAWGAKYMITASAARPPSNWKPLAKVAIYQIWIDDGFEGLARATEGAKATVTQLRDDEIRLRVEGAPPQGADVHVSLARYPRLRAFQDGKAIALRPDPAHAGGPEDQIAIHAGNGEVVIRTNGALPGAALGWLCTLAGAAMLAGLGYARLRPDVARAARERLRAALAGLPRVARSPVASPGATALVTLPIALALAAAALALPVTRRGALRLGVFGRDTRAVRRLAEGSDRWYECPENWITRRWWCGPHDATVPDAQVWPQIGHDPSPPPRIWPFSDAWTALQIENHGAATLEVSYARVRPAGFAHLHASPQGAFPTVVELQLGDGAPVQAKLVHGWTTVALPKPSSARPATLAVRLRFAGDGGADLAVEVDDDARNPELPKQ